MHENYDSNTNLSVYKASLENKGNITIYESVIFDTFFNNHFLCGMNVFYLIFFVF